MGPAPSALYFVWDPPGATVSVLLSLELVDALGHWVEGSRRAGQQVRGVLLGHREADGSGRAVITIEDCEPAAPEEVGRVAEAEGLPFAAVGYLSSGPHLSRRDINLIRGFLRDPDPVLLTIGPGADLVAQFTVLDPASEPPADAGWFAFNRTALAGDRAHLLRSPKELVSRYEPKPPDWRRRAGMAVVAVLLLGGGIWQVLSNRDRTADPTADAATTKSEAQGVPVTWEAKRNAIPGPPRIEGADSVSASGQQIGLGTVPRIAEPAIPQDRKGQTKAPRTSRPVRIVKDDGETVMPEEADRQEHPEGAPAKPVEVAAAPAPVRVPDPGPTPPAPKRSSIATGPLATVAYEPAPDSGMQKAMRRIPGLNLLPPWRPKRGQTFTPAKAIHEAKPAGAARLQEDSKVRLAVFVDAKGRVTGVEALTPRADDHLTGMATTAIYNSRFEPARLNGRPVDSRLIAIFDFHGRNRPPE